MWECVSCYGNKIVTDNASPFEGEYQFLGFLPFEEAKYNKTLAAFIKYVGKDKADQFSAYAFQATLAFADAIKAAVAKGVNGITRATTAGIKTLTDFDAGGMAGTHSFKTGKTTNCFVQVQFKSGQWVRVYPMKNVRLQGLEQRRPQGESARLVSSGSDLRVLELQEEVAELGGFLEVGHVRGLLEPHELLAGCFQLVRVPLCSWRRAPPGRGDPAP